MKIVTANIKSNPLMNIELVKADVQKVLATGADLIGFQEIGPKNYKDAVEGAAMHFASPYSVVGLNSAIPILYNADKFHFITSKLIKTHRGRVMVSPARFILCTTFTDIERVNVIVHLNTHFVSGKYKKRVTFRRWRINMWNKHFQMLSDLYYELRAAGYKVIITGDFNDPEVDAFLMKAHNRLDYVFTSFGRKGVQRTWPINSDHDVLEANIS